MLPKSVPSAGLLRGLASRVRSLLHGLFNPASHKAMPVTRNIRTLAWVLTLFLTACDARPVEYTPFALDPCGAVADVALQKQILQLLIGGAMSEKLDPKTMPEGGLVSITDAYRAKSGELRARNGYTTLTQATDSGVNIAACRALMALQGGNLGLIGSLASPGTADAMYVYSKTENKWMHNTRGYQPMPMAVTSLVPLESRNLSTSAAVSDLVNPDVAIASNVKITAFTDRGAGAGATVSYELTDMQNGASIQGLTSSGFTGKLHRVAAGGSSYLALFVNDTIGAPSTIRAIVVTVATLAVNSYAVSAVGAVAAACQGFDVKARPGSNNIIVAFPATVGGTTLVEFNPATGAIATGPTNIAAADSSQQVALLEDPFSTGSYYMSSSSNVTGIVLRKLSTAFAVTATNNVDAAAVGISSMTGHLTSATTYEILWNFTSLKTGSGTVGGVATVVSWQRNANIASRSFRVNGKWYVIVSGPLTTGPFTGYILATDFTATDLIGPRVAGIILPATYGGTIDYSGGKGQITSVVALSATTFAAGISNTTKFFPNIVVTHNVMSGTINFAPKLRNARELSGTTFFPGGVVTQYDGSSVDLATFLETPDAPHGFSTAAGGGMTASGAYQYVQVYKKLDARGRVIRGAPSVPGAVSLGAGDHSASMALSTNRIGVIPGITDPTIEVYRAGPAAAGGIIYNKVGEVANDSTVDFVTFNDTMADTVAATGELLYDPLANSGVLNNFPSPSTQLLEVLDNRVFVVSAENPTEIWPSKEYKPGAGLAFNPNLVIRITGSPITALAAMDGRLVVFQGASTWVIPIGPGPNDNGQGTFGDPQMASLNIGCVDPNSVVATPDGIMFQAAQGIYLLTRGLDMQYIGAAVEDTMAAMTTGGGIAGASLVAGRTQVRFHGANTVASPTTSSLVYDYYFQQWFEWNLPVDAGPQVGNVSAGGNYYYADGDGLVFQESTGFADLSSGNAVQWSFRLPPLAVAQIGGWSLTYELQVIGSYEGPHILQVTLQPSYAPSLGVSGSRTISTFPASYQFAFRPKRQKATAMQPTIIVTPTGTAEGARISALSLVYAGKGGRFPLAANRRLG